MIVRLPVLISNGIATFSFVVQSSVAGHDTHKTPRSFTCHTTATKKKHNDSFGSNALLTAKGYFAGTSKHWIDS